MFKFLRKLRSKILFQLFYLGDPPWDSGITPPEVVEFLDAHPPGRALDLGCGTGTNVITLAEHGWEAKGVDFVPRAVRQARRKARRAEVHVEFAVGDVADKRHFAGRYDLILDIGCYHALSEAQRRQYRQNIAAHLADGGTYMLYGFLSGDSSRISERDVDAFQDVLRLRKRVNSQDPNRSDSAWFWFSRKESRS
jgi:cyclopropane fatty-acyl-phospholipid synthase-like methyltransferase